MKILSFIFISFLSLCFFAKPAFAGSATLTWNANSESDLAGYQIYYGTSPRTGTDPKVCSNCGYTNNISLGKVTTYVFNNLTDGQTYYFSVSAYDTSSNKSVFSAEVSKVIPAADITAPTLSNGLPSGTVAAGTTQTNLSLTTNENATCKYAVTAGVSYASMTNTFTTTGTTTHSKLITGLQNGTSYSYYVKCVDSSSNANTNDYTISFSVALPADITPPTRSAGLPTGSLAAGTTQTTITLTTNENATCKYATMPDTTYVSMTNTFTTTGATTHSKVISGFQNGTNYNYYIRCIDGSSNANTDDYIISFTIASPTDSTAPTRSGGLPSGSLAVGTTQTTLTLTTNENATCKLSTAAGVSYASMPITFFSTGSTNHSHTVTSLMNGTSYNYYIRCSDASNNFNIDDYQIAFSVQAPAISSGGGGGSSSDVTAPIIASINTSNLKSNLVQINWATNESATTKIEYGITNNYGQVSQSISLSTNHSIQLNNLQPATTYYFRAISVDAAGNQTMSSAQIFTTPDIDHTAQSNQQTNTNENNNPDTSTDTTKLTSLYGQSSAVVEQMSNSEASETFSYDKFTPLSNQTKPIYEKIVILAKTALTEQHKYAIAAFIHNGTQTTQRLGAGERAGVIASYNQAFGKLPQNTDEWRNVIKIASGRWTDQNSANAEKEAKTNFKKIYKRDPIMSDAHDSNAVMIMAYGLRPVTRNLNSEKAGILTAKAVLGHNPQIAKEWDMARAISYSGAKR